MHMAVFLPVPPYQLFPSGGLNYLHNYKGPEISRGPLFLPKIPAHENGPREGAASLFGLRGDQAPVLSVSVVVVVLSVSRMDCTSETAEDDDEEEESSSSSSPPIEMRVLAMKL